MISNQVGNEVVVSVPHFEVNDASAFVDAAAYAEMAALVGRAEHTIKLTFYLFGGPDADRMIDIMAERQTHGVSVRVLIDHTIGREVLDLGVVLQCRRTYTRMRTLVLMSG